MTWPERYHPFGIPTDWDEFGWFVLTTAGLTAFWAGKYAADVWHAIPRMAAHKYSNPSRRAILRNAAEEASMMSFGRMAMVSGFARATAPLAVVEAAMLLGAAINYVAPTVRDPDTGLSSYESYQQEMASKWYMEDNRGW
jgi:hypothetical protein